MFRSKPDTSHSYTLCYFFNILLEKNNTKSVGCAKLCCYVLHAPPRLCGPVQISIWVTMRTILSFFYLEKCWNLTIPSKITSAVTVRYFKDNKSCIYRYLYLYNKTRHSYIYVAYSRPNGWTKWAEIFLWTHVTHGGRVLIADNLG